MLETGPTHVDGEDLVKQIASAEEYDGILSLLSNYCFEECLQLTFEAIKLNAENENVWQARRIILFATNSDVHEELEHSDVHEELEHSNVHEELETIKSLLNKGFNDNFWKHRLLISQRLDHIDVNAIRKELEYTRSYLRNHINDSSAWCYIEYLYDCGNSYALDRLQFVKEVLFVDKNKYSRCAWSHRYSLFSILETSVAIEEFKIARSILSKSDEGKKHKIIWAYMFALAQTRGGSYYLKKANDFMRGFLLNTDGRNHVVWDCKRKWAMLDWIDLRKEFKFAGDILFRQPENGYAWSYRLWLFHHVGIFCHKKELRIIDKILSRDAKNVCAWYYRQRLLDAFGGGENEADYCDKFLKRDIRNDCAWNRKSVVMRAGRGALSFPDRKRELKFAESVICQKPKCKYAWFHLQSLYLDTDFDNKVVECILKKVLGQRICGYLKDDIAGSNIIMSCILETLCYIKNRGYKPGQEVEAVVNELYSRNNGTIEEKYDKALLEVEHGKPSQVC